MRCHRALLTLVPFLIGLAQGCDGCSSRSPARATKPGLSTSVPADAAKPGLPLDSGVIDDTDHPFGVPSDSVGAVIFETVGEPDAANRYSSAVMIHPQLASSETKLRECSGVIVGPRLVLTAGHCVCQRHQLSGPKEPLQHQVDGGSCAPTAIVTVFFYEQERRKPRQIVGAVSEQHPGRVQAHPRLEVRLSEREDILSSHADLALIVLDAPVPVGFLPARLAESSTALGETLMRVGFGYDETLGALDGRRLVQSSKVLKALTSPEERFLLEEADGSIFRGDDGGPCFRETPRGPELVGISTTGLGQESSMTSLSPYSKWLRHEISLAESVQPPLERGARQ